MFGTASGIGNWPSFGDYIELVIFLGQNRLIEL